MQTISGFYTNETIYKPTILAEKEESNITAESENYAVLAGKISVSKLHKQTKDSFSGERNSVELVLYWNIIKKSQNKLLT